MKEKINHICPKCNQYICNSIQKHINYCNGLGTRRKREKKGHNNPWNKGLKIKDLMNIKGEKWTNEYSKSISEGIKKSFSDGTLTGRASTPEKEIERRHKISERMKIVGGGYRKGSGRGKKGWYKGYWCDSSWELAWIIYNLEHNIYFERNLERFEYIYNNKKYNYLPDFKIGDTYIEVKGYMTNQVVCKIEQFLKNIIVIKKEEMKPILQYVKDKYGKNFISLYE